MYLVDFTNTKSTLAFRQTPSVHCVTNSMPPSNSCRRRCSSTTLTMTSCWCFLPLVLALLALFSPAGGRPCIRWRRSRSMCTSTCRCMNGTWHELDLPYTWIFVSLDAKNQVNQVCIVWVSFEMYSIAKQYQCVRVDVTPFSRALYGYSFFFISIRNG